MNCSFLENITLTTIFETAGDYAFENCPATISYTHEPTKSDPWSGNVSTSYHAGTGLETNPYVIFNGNDFAYFINQVNAGNQYENTYFIVKTNINMSNYTLNMIGSKDYPFSGYFNGKGHSIYNFTISGTTQYVGLFPSLKGTIEDICFSGVTISSTVTDTGSNYCGLIAYLEDGAVISNVYANVTVTISGSYYNYAGGLVGYMNGGTITNSYSSGSVTATNATFYAYAGGLVGFVNGGSLIGCFSIANVKAKGATSVFSYNGGLIGDKNTAGVTIANCYRYSEAVLTRYDSIGSFNSDGNILNKATILTSISSIWSPTIWNIGIEWPSLRNL